MQEENIPKSLSGFMFDRIDCTSRVRKVHCQGKLYLAWNENVVGSLYSIPQQQTKWKYINLS